MTAAETARPGEFVPKMHVSLNVRDIEASVRFYEAFLGVPAHKRRHGYANFDLARPPLKLALQEHDPAAPGAAPGETGSLSHLGIQVGTTSDVQAARERLTASGLASFDEGDTVCCYARQDKVWAHDPDGNGWEVYVLLDEMDDADDARFAAGGVPAAESACCGASARAKAGDGPPCCAEPADGSACCG